MKPEHFILVVLCGCAAGTPTTYPSSSGAMGVGSSAIGSSEETPQAPVDTGESDTAEEPEDSGR